MKLTKYKLNATVEISENVVLVNSLIYIGSAYSTICGYFRNVYTDKHTPLGKISAIEYNKLMDEYLVEVAEEEPIDPNKLVTPATTQQLIDELMMCSDLPDEPKNNSYFSDNERYYDRCKLLNFLNLSPATSINELIEIVKYEYNKL